MDQANMDKLDWKCSNCGYTLVAPAPPDKCPSCSQQCEFVLVTCFIPDCGGPGAGTMDARLGGERGFTRRRVK